MKRLQRAWLWLQLAVYIIQQQAIKGIHRKLRNRLLPSPPPLPDGQTRNVVVIGASFAGYEAANVLLSAIAPGYKLVVVEPRSHFHWTWVLPRFCVVPGHYQKTFIPYGGHLPKNKQGQLEWIRGRAVKLARDKVTVKKARDAADEGEGEGEKRAAEKEDKEEEHEIAYEYLVIATGSVSKEQAGTDDVAGLPARLLDDERADGVERMKRMHDKIRKANNIVVVGGGAAGVELATDAASYFAGEDDAARKKVTLVHSRDAPMHRYEKRLQKAAMESMEKLGVEVILGDRLVGEEQNGEVTMRSGRKVECDMLVSDNNHSGSCSCGCGCVAGLLRPER